MRPDDVYTLESFLATAKRLGVEVNERYVLQRMAVVLGLDADKALPSYDTEASDGQ